MALLSFIRYICGNRTHVFIDMKRIFSLIIVSLLAASLFAQSRDAMKKMFDEGRFEEAKPIFATMLAKNPKNSEYNYWYAACCLETGESVDVREMLEFAASRKIVKANWYLGEWYWQQMDYRSASECFDIFIDDTQDDSCR